MGARARTLGKIKCPANHHPRPPPPLPQIRDEAARNCAKTRHFPILELGRGGGGAGGCCKCFIYFVRDCSSVSLIKEMLYSIFHKKQLWYFRIRMQIKCCVERFIFNTSDV